MRGKFVFLGIIVVLIGFALTMGLTSRSSSGYNSSYSFDNSHTFKSYSQSLSKGDVFSVSASPSKSSENDISGLWVGIMNESTYSAGPPWKSGDMIDFASGTTPSVSCAVPESGSFYAVIGLVNENESGTVYYDIETEKTSGILSTPWGIPPILAGGFLVFAGMGVGLPFGVGKDIGPLAHRDKKESTFVWFILIYALPMLIGFSLFSLSVFLAGMGNWNAVSISGMLLTGAIFLLLGIIVTWRIAESIAGHEKVTTKEREHLSHREPIGSAKWFGAIIIQNMMLVIPFIVFFIVSMITFNLITPEYFLSPTSEPPASLTLLLKIAQILIIVAIAVSVMGLYILWRMAEVISGHERTSYSLTHREEKGSTASLFILGILPIVNLYFGWKMAEVVSAHEKSSGHVSKFTQYP